MPLIRSFSLYEYPPTVFYDEIPVGRDRLADVAYIEKKW